MFEVMPEKDLAVIAGQKFADGRNVVAQLPHGDRWILCDVEGGIGFDSPIVVGIEID